MIADRKIRSQVFQLLLLAAFALLVAIVAISTIANLKSRGIPLGFDFLRQPAGFQIAEAIIEYSPRDPYWWAAVVGLANSLFVAILVIVLSSIIGLFLGVGRLSSHPLVSGLCRIWIEVVRNTPVVVLLIFVYALWWKILPQVQQSWWIGPGIHLSVRGLVTPAIRWTGSIGTLMAALTIVVGGILVASKISAYRQQTTGTRPPFVAATICAMLFAFVAFVATYKNQFALEFAIFRRANFFGGWQLTPELTSILLGLTIYTAGFIGEIVRGGILSIGKGQWEAASALGLSMFQTYRLVIIPLALRTIIPPLNSQFINVVKNSTLAIVVGYQDFMTVMSTVINKSSHAIEGVFIILGVFLLVNLALSATMNWYNRRIAIVER